MSIFDFSGANEQQREAIISVDGPLLITAGPGTGKTFTLVQRTKYMIREKGIDPKQIWISTYTNKAAKEIVTRLSNAFASGEKPFNISEMYVGTFHTLCLRILNNYLKYTSLKPNYSILDDFAQAYLLADHVNEFYKIPAFDQIVSPVKWLSRDSSREKTTWEKAMEICGYIDYLTEELVDPEELIHITDEDSKDSSVIRAFGEMLLLYRKILREKKPNSISFSGMQTECWRLLHDHPGVLAELREQIRYFMVDEYQDTNHVQNEILLLLAGESNNLCVVGDDDQSLYRFRGATVRNILEFENKTGMEGCKVVSLTENYRSSRDIIDFYNHWMENPIGFSWTDEKHPEDIFRLVKTIVPHDRTAPSTPAVFKLETQDNEQEWCERICQFVHSLYDAGKITDYNQIAFLFSSVKAPEVTALSEYLKNNGIPVYSPRSNMFFKRYEIRLLIGCLILLFPDYADKVDAGRIATYLTNGVQEYYSACKAYAKDVLPGFPELQRFIEQYAAVHKNLDSSADYGISGLLYRMFAFRPFCDWLQVDMQISGCHDRPSEMDILPARNLALFSQILADFERNEHVSVLTPQNVGYVTWDLFSRYLKMRWEAGVSEYNDETEYTPSGCVSFMTIHQAKGMEFPIVVVDSLGQKVWHEDSPLDAVEKDYFSERSLEPLAQRELFDFWRLYYTAFSRAQNMLVLTCNRQSWKDSFGNDRSVPSEYFEPALESLHDVSEDADEIGRFSFAQLKKTDLKPVLSFTSHISVYERCSLQYKFFRELGFASHRWSNMQFGNLVHKTIEDIHRAVLLQRQSEEPAEEYMITPENIERWFLKNYDELKGKGSCWLDSNQLQEALKQVMAYANAHKPEDWNLIRKAEVSLMLPEEKFILKGVVDLIQGENGTVELLDFKSERKEQIEGNPERLEHYKKQLRIYAYLVEKEENVKVASMHIYCTPNPEDPLISFDYNEKEIDLTIEDVRNVADKILERDYTGSAKDRGDKKTCAECDFRYYCGVEPLG